MRVMLLLLFVVINAFADEKSFFDDRERGYWWYEKSTSPVQNKKINTQQAQLTSKQVLESQGKEWEESMAKAVISPTNENIKNYLQQTKKINEQAQKFSIAFKESIWINPEFDYSLEKPVITEAINASNESELIKNEVLLSKISKEYGLILFFKGSCPHCHRFSPIIKGFSEKYNFSMIPVTLDGGVLPEFKNPKQNYFIGEKLKVSAVPALYLVNPTTNAIAPISFGYTDWSTLSQKIIIASKMSLET